MTVTEGRQVIELGTAPGEEYGYKRRCKVTLEVELRPLQGGSRETTSHRKLEEGETALELSICGNVWRPDGKDIVSGGQNIDEIRRIAGELTKAPPYLRRLLEVWERWHLNGMRAGCEHQGEKWTCTAPGCQTENGWHLKPEYPKRGDACRRCGRNRWDEPSDHCPETGYRFGTSWLLEELPAEIVDEVRGWLGGGESHV